MSKKIEQPAAGMSVKDVYKYLSLGKPTDGKSKSGTADFTTAAINCEKGEGENKKTFPAIVRTGVVTITGFNKKDIIDQKTGEIKIGKYSCLILPESESEELYEFWDTKFSKRLNELAYEKKMFDDDNKGEIPSMCYRKKEGKKIVKSSTPYLYVQSGFKMSIKRAVKRANPKDNEQKLKYIDVPFKKVKGDRTIKAILTIKLGDIFHGTVTKIRSQITEIIVLKNEKGLPSALAETLGDALLDGNSDLIAEEGEDSSSDEEDDNEKNEREQKEIAELAKNKKNKKNKVENSEDTDSESNLPSKSKKKPKSEDSEESPRKKLDKKNGGESQKKKKNSSESSSEEEKLPKKDSKQKKHSKKEAEDKDSESEEKKDEKKKEKRNKKHADSDDEVAGV